MSTRRIFIIIAAIFLFAGSSILALPTGFNAMHYKGKISSGYNTESDWGANTIDDNTPYITPLIYNGNNNDDPRLVTGDNTAVPEPTTIALFGLGALGLGFFRRNRR